MKIYDPKKILVPVDFSRLSKEALRVGLEIGELRNIDVTPLHVAKEPEEHIPHRVYGEEMVPILGEGVVGPQIPFSKTLDGIRMDLEQRLNFILKDLSANPKIKPLVFFGEPIKEILHLAESEGFDLIVMGTHGREGLNRFLLGSVAEQVIRRAPCPVFVIREKVVAQRLEEIAKEEVATN
jgi:nucleotide-binding universal stress UspA family protein